MRKLRRRYRKVMTELKIAAVLVVVVIAGLPVVVSSLGNYLWFIPAIALLIFFLKFLFRPNKFINEQGYVVLSDSNELEHRYIAKQLLCRELKANEIVHHINGKKTDNKVRNLCLMDREKHELFHSWLSWKRNKSGRYPPFRDQKRLLEDEYGGTLLENISKAQKTFVPAIPVASLESNISVANRSEPNRFGLPREAIRQDVYRSNSIPPRATIIATKQDPELQKKLFIELRTERKRLADQMNIPAYKVFHDKTLIEMSQAMPDSKHAMFEITDMDKEKYETYGAQFIVVIRKFKTDFDINQKAKKGERFINRLC